jgi:lipopolysaccharide/colanic/teichoic acid biosynthesis glycosyltransferase
MGGYFVVRYMPLENVTKTLRRRYTGSLYWLVFIFHYIWYRALPKIPWLDTLYFSSKISWLDALHLSVVKKRNRVLSKAEVWGRLSYCGMRVIAESSGDGDIYLIAQRVAFPVAGKRPSYYPIVALEKVGLDGEIIYAYKIRTMFPFSEFLQKRIFEDHGLASTGKFSNDFRLTEIGKFLRRYWLDELPQIFDWLRGDIKLVGLRATSRHFLSLYPRNFLDLYVQIKPGLIPPIYDESTKGFDQIVEVELTYLQRYWDQPFRTDVRYLIQTFTDIVFRGIRSK